MKSDPSSFKDILDRHKGIGPGFDLLRIGLAVAIFLLHAHWLTGQGGNALAPATDMMHTNSGWQGWSRPFAVAMVPMFFALSGFLVMGSAQRLRSTSTFLAFRALRIFPALTTEVILSAVVLGAIFTDLPLRDYYTSPGFFRYFGNIIGWITFELPGAFPDNPVPHLVNTNLWTLPSEFDCYVITAVLMVTGLLFRRKPLTIVTVIATVIFIGLNSFTDFAVRPRVFAGYTITYYFFIGLLFFQWRERIPHKWSWFLVGAVLSYIFLFFNHTIYLAPLFVTYCTMFIGLLAIPKIKLLSSGDYSYGVYLYGFPITQMMMALFPALRGHLLLTVVGGLVPTFLFAVFSWHTIEKPLLSLKKKLPPRFFPVPAKVIVPMPEQRAGDAGTGLENPLKPSI